VRRWLGSWGTVRSSEPRRGFALSARGFSPGRHGSLAMLPEAEAIGLKGQSPAGSTERPIGSREAAKEGGPGCLARCDAGSVHGAPSRRQSLEEALLSQRGALAPRDKARLRCCPRLKARSRTGSRKAAKGAEEGGPGAMLARFRGHRPVVRASKRLCSLSVGVRPHATWLTCSARTAFAPAPSAAMTPQPAALPRSRIRRW